MSGLVEDGDGLAGDYHGKPWRTPAGPTPGAPGFIERHAFDDRLRTGTDWGNLTV